MNALVQLLRNGMCCVQDLRVFEGSVLHDSAMTARYYRFPPPLDRTTPLELCIAMTQCYACVTVTLAGYQIITNSGVLKLKRITRLVELRSKTTASSLLGSTDKIINRSLLSEANAATKSVFIGVNVMCIGMSFFWLAANSLHITTAGWIGGLPALISALSVMEICLCPLLYYMIRGGSEKIATAKKMKVTAQCIATAKDRSWLDFESYTLLTTTGDGGWIPFWANPAPVHQHSKMEEQMLEEEILSVQAIVDTLLPDKDGNTKFDKVLEQSVEETALRLEANARIIKWEGYREYLYFILNAIAFYGYFLCILCYLYDEDEKQPSHAYALKLGLSTRDADWHGNFAGDLMWTVEPIVVMASPLFFSYLKPSKPAKTKLE